MLKKFLSLIRIFTNAFVKRSESNPLQIDKSGQEASDLIKHLLLSEDPIMIARFGSVELQCVVDSLNNYSIKNCVRYVTHKSDSLGYSRNLRYSMANNAGFFPTTDKYLNKFSRLMLDIMPMVDVLGSWQKNETIFEEVLKDAIKIPLDNLEPYFHKDPWSEVLNGKKVLVIHPFEESIKEQYERRSLMFKDERVLPSFDLQIIKAVQTIANNSSIYTTWFEALEFMKSEIDKRDFDIAIIGCGAYGFPLAAYVKSIGKKAIHLGGATQMLFGIKSKAWEENPKLNYLINDNWVRPKKSERPANYKMVEGGRYW